jgi:hypothetical protein
MFRGPVLQLWAPVILYMAAIFFVSADPDPGIPAGADKTLHWLAYFGLAVVVLRAVAGGLPVRLDRRTVAIGMLITIGHGAFDEVHQMFVPGRSADVYDLLADAAGAVSCAVVCWAWGILSTAPDPKARKAARQGPRASRDEL